MKLQISEKPPQLLHIKTVGQRCNPALVRISIYLWPSEPLLCLLKEGTCLTKVALRFEKSLPPLEKFVNCPSFRYGNYPVTGKYASNVREEVKYYFADFVRKGGTPPFTEKVSAKRSYGFGGYGFITTTILSLQ